LARHRLTVKVPDSLPPLRLDPSLLEHVLSNLLDNAAKYTPEGSEIEVVAEQHRFSISLQVRDRGPGIPEDELGKIFDLFHRVRQGDRNRAGTGLGLAISRGFAQAMGAEVRARNREDGGAVFEVDFPSRLIVERGADEVIEPAIRRFLRATLAANGYEVLEAANAHAGLTLARSEKPDVLILDLGLPDRDGLELLRELRAESEVPVLVLSARDSESAKVAALDLGADDYVTKPFGAEELMARLRVALRHRLRSGGEAPRYELDGLVVDVLRRQVSLRGEALHLSPKEYRLLELLARHAGKVLTHRYLLEQLWPEGGEADAQYLRVYVRQLRQKLGDPAEAPHWLLTEAGVGYRLLAPG